MIPHNGTVMNDAFFDITQKTIYEMVERVPNTHLTNFEGLTIASLDGMQLNVSYE